MKTRNNKTGFGLLSINKRDLFIALLITACCNVGKTQVKDHQKQVGHTFSIDGDFINEDHSGKIELYVWDKLISENRKYNEPHRQYSYTIKNGKFIFTIDSIKNGSYIVLSKEEVNGMPLPIVDLYRIEQGDRIHLDIHSVKNKSKAGRLFSDDGGAIYDYSLKFSGPGFSKYQCRYELDSLYVYYVSNSKYSNDEADAKRSAAVRDMQHGVDLAAYVTKKQLEYLKGYEETISKPVLDELRTDLISSNMGTDFLSYFSVRQDKKLPENDRKALHELYLSSEMLKLFNDIPEEKGRLSAWYLAAAVSKVLKESALLYGDEQVYALIIKNYSGLLRERIITAYLNSQYSFIPYPEARKILDNALSVVKDPYCLAILNALNKQGTGLSLYKFELPDREGRIVKLDDFKGKVLFIDFFYTGCGNCASYFKNTVSKAEEHFKTNPDVVFITISIDGNKDKWIKSLEGGLYTSDQAINLYTAGKGMDDPLIKQLNIFGYPHPILVDRAGKIFNNNYNELGRGNPPGLINLINQAISKK